MYPRPARGHHYDVIAGDSYQVDRRRDLYVIRARYLRPTTDLLASYRRALQSVTVVHIVHVAHITTDNALM